MPAAVEQVRRRDQLTGFFFSASLHLAILFLGSGTLLQAPQYGIELGSGGIELCLVAAPPHGAAESQENTDDKPIPSETEALPTVAKRAQTPATGPAGDGSSPVPGRDPTTLYRPGGGQTNSKPTVLRNPVPAYPEAALAAGQEGTVVLLIAIDKIGQAARVEVQRSSGYLILDESALTAVRRWKFIPARAAGVPADSLASLRVRFALKEGSGLSS